MIAPFHFLYFGLFSFRFGFLQIIHLSSLYYSRQWSSVRSADTGRPWGDDRSAFISQRRKGSSSSSSSAAGPGSLRQRINRCCGSLSLSSSAVLSFLCFVGEGTFMVRPFSSSSLAFGWLPFLPNSSTTLKDSGLCGEARSTLMVGMLSVMDLWPHAWGSAGGGTVRSWTDTTQTLSTLFQCCYGLLKLKLRK